MGTSYFSYKPYFQFSKNFNEISCVTNTYVNNKIKIE